jgi:hypothetical protein
MSDEPPPYSEPIAIPVIENTNKVIVKVQTREPRAIKHMTTRVWTKSPQPITCQFCQKRVTTKTREDEDCLLICFMLFCCVLAFANGSGIGGCCCDADIVHSCPECGKDVGSTRVTDD